MAVIENLESPLTQALKTTLPSVAAHIATQLNERRLRQQQAVGLQAALGINPNQAQALSYLDPQTLGAYVKQEVQRPHREQLAGLAKQLLGGGSIPQNNPTQGVLATSGGQAGVGAAQGGVPGIDMSNFPEQMTEQDLRLLMDIHNQETNRNLKVSENEKNRELKRQLAKFQAEEKGKGREFERSMQKQKLQAAEAKEARDAIRENIEKTRIRNKELDTQIESDKATERDLDELLALNATGQLVQGKTHVALEALGWDKFFNNDVSQIAAKDIERMGAELMKSNKTGGKMTNDIFNSLKATLPSLKNTQTGFDALAKSVKFQTQINRLLNEKEKQINNRYIKKGLEVPLTMVRDEAKAEVAPMEAKINRERCKIIGNAMVRSNPQINEMLKSLPNGTKKKLNGQVIEKSGRDWILLPNYKSDITEGI